MARIPIQSNDSQDFRHEEEISNEESKEKGRRTMNCIDTYVALPTCLSGPEGHAPSQLGQTHSILDDSNLKSLPPFKDYVHTEHGGVLEDY